MQSDVGGKLKYIITADIDQFNDSLASASKALDKFAENLNETAAQSGKALGKGVTEGAEQAQSSISKFVNNSIAELKDFASAATSVATNLGTTFAGMATATFGTWATKGITDTQFLEDTQIQMQALTHSTELGNKAMAYATQYFKNNPFNRFDVTDATKQLIQFGATVEEVPALLEKMGNVSLSTGVEINELARIYQQTSSDGKVGLMDIEKLAARGVPIWDAFAKATGKSAAKIREETRAGGVSVEDFKKAFDYLVDEEAMKQNEKTFSRQLDRFKGRLSNMKAALAGYSMDMEKGLVIDENGLYRSVTRMMQVFSDTMSGDIGTKLLNALSNLASKIAPYIDKFTAKIPGILEKVANAIDFLSDHFELMIPILGGALTMFGSLASGIPGLDKVIGPLGNSVKGLGKAFGNLSLPMKIVVAILGAGAFKAFKDGSLNESLKSILSSLGKLAKALAPVVARLAELAANIGSKVVTAAVTAFAKVLEVLANVISAIPEPMLTAIVEAILGLLVVKKVTTPLKNFGHAAKVAFDVFTTGNGIKNAISTFKDIANIGKKAGEAAKVATGTMDSVTKIGQATQTAGQTLTKGQQFMKTMRSGIVNLILLAGAIVALALALKVAYEAIPSDIGGLAAKLGIMAGAVVAMGTFAWTVGKLKDISWKSIAQLTALAAPIVTFAGAIWLVGKAVPDDLGSISAKLGILAGVVVAMGAFAEIVGKLKGINWKSILELTALAVPLVAFAGAMWVVYNAVPDDLGGLSAKLGILAGAIVGMGIIAAVAGAFKTNIATGLLAVIGIAGTIALCALALQYTYNTMPDDFGGLQAKIGSLALVIVEIGALAAVVGALMMTGVGAAILAAGLVAIIAIAGTLALTGVALKSAYDNLPSDFGGFQARIGSLAAVVGEIAALSTALGWAQILSLGTMNLGLLTLIEISWALASCAAGIKSAANDMPGDMDAVKEKIKAGIEFLKEMKDQYGGNGGLFAAIGNFFWNGEGTQQFDTFIAISRKLAATAYNLSVLVEKMPEGTKLDAVITKIDSAVEFLMKLRESYCGEGGLIGNLKNFFSNEESTRSFDTINEIAQKLSTLADNLENLASVSTGKLSKVVNGKLFSTLKTAVDTLKQQFGSEHGGVWYDIGHFFDNQDSTATLDNAVKIGETLGKLVENLSKIEDVQPSKLNKAINTTIPKLKEVVNKLKEEFTESGGLFDTIGKWFSNDDSTASLEKAKEIAEKLGGLVDNLGKIQDLDTAKLSRLTGDSEDNPIIKLKSVVSRLKTTFVDDADSVTNQLKDYDTGGLEKAKTVAENIKNISDTLSGVADIEINVPGVETFISNMKTIVSKIVEEFGDDGELSSFPEDVATGVSNVKSVVSDLSQMTQDIENLRDVDMNNVNPKIDHIKQVIQRILQVFVPDGQGEEALNLEAFSDDTISSQVSQVQTIVTAMKTIAQTASEIPDVPEGVMGEGGKISKVRELVKEIAYSLDSSGEDAIYLDALETIDLSAVPKIVSDMKTIASGVQDFPDAATGAENLKTFVSKLSETIKSLGTELVNNGVLESMKVLGTNLTDNILEGFQDQFESNIPDSVLSFYNSMKSYFDMAKSNFEARGKDVAKWMIDGLKNGFSDEKGNVWESFRGVINNATNGDMKWVAENQSQSIGKAMAQGVAAGINAEIWRINYAVGNLSSAAISKLKSVLGIASPSKVFYELGEYTGEGLAEGLESQIKSVSEAAEDIAEAIRSPFEAMDNLSVGVESAGGAGSGLTKYLTINQNNNINNGMDYNAMMADLKWELFTA